MLKWVYYLCLAIVTVSCNNLLKSTPKGLLSESQMTGILVEMHLTEATVRTANDSILRLNDTTGLQIRYAEVFRKYEVSPADFNTSLNYYIERIDLLDKIYTDVITQISELEVQYQEQLSKQTNAFVNKYKKANPVDNPWYRTLQKGEIKIQYFDPLIYR